MPRGSKTGVRGLYRARQGNWVIDLRWLDPVTGMPRRHREEWPATVTTTAAKERARNLLNLALAGKLADDTGNAHRLGEALKEYLRWSEINRPRSIKSRRSIGTVLLATLGDLVLDEITPLHVERLKEARKRERVTNATINRCVAMLKHMCKMASDRWGWMRKETAAAIRAVEKLPEPPGRVRYLIGDERERLMAALPVWLRPVVITALLTGMRLGEIIGLKRADIDLGRREITLVRTKSDRVRRVPIADALVPVLEAALAFSTTAIVFINPRGRIPYTDSAVKNGFARAVRKARIEDLHFHDLRHDFATNVRRDGHGLDVIASLLGHTTLQMAARYAHLGRDALRAAVANLPSPCDQSVLPTGPPVARLVGDRSSC